MGRITNLAEIQAAANPVDVIGRRVPLQRSGGDHIGRCPFHSAGRERTPSLHVRPDKGWYCHGPCKRGGTALDFILEYENLEFLEAVELLASEVGVQVQYEDTAGGGSDNQDAPRRRDLYAAVQAAAEHYVAELANHSEALGYAVERGLTDPVRRRWQIGYAKGNGVREAADPDLLHSAGVLKKSKNGELYDPLAGRLIIPLHDTTGRPIAFTGRALPTNESAAKYLNTQDTRIYKKGEHLYAYHAAVRTIRSYPDGDKPSPVVVEGQLNAIACQEQGIPAVAPGGSTLTERQALLLQRLHTSTRLAYDDDTAGSHATHAAAHILRGIGQTVWVAKLQPPDSYAVNDTPDPDDLAAAGHVIFYEDVDLMVWAIQELLTETAHTAAWARQVSDHVLPLLAAHPDDLVREVDETTLAQSTGLSLEAIRARQVHAAAQDSETSAAVTDTDTIDTTLTPGRLLAAIALQLPIDTSDPNRWQLYLCPLDLPVSLLSVLSDIGRVRTVAATYSLAATTAIRRLAAAGTLDYARHLHYWATVELPGPADLTGLGRVQDTVVRDEHTRRLQTRELI